MCTENFEGKKGKLDHLKPVCVANTLLTADTEDVVGIQRVKSARTQLLWKTIVHQKSPNYQENRLNITSIH